LTRLPHDVTIVDENRLESRMPLMRYVDLVVAGKIAVSDAALSSVIAILEWQAQTEADAIREVSEFIDALRNGTSSNFS
jgi:hypothetical protein